MFLQPDDLHLFDRALFRVYFFTGGGSGDADNWTLEVLDAKVGGNSLGILNSALCNGSPYQQLSYNIGGILRAEADWTGPTAGIGFDDLSFAPVPLPVGCMLLLTGMACSAWMQRRKTRESKKLRIQRVPRVAFSYDAR